MKRLPTLVFLAGLLLLVPVTALAQATYKIGTIIRVGDMAGDTLIDKNRIHWTVGLSDRGHLLFSPWTPDETLGDLFLQFHEGKFTTIAAPGAPAPDGVWPKKLAMNVTAMTQRGAAMFNALEYGSGRWFGIYRYDPDTGKVSLVVKKEMPTSEGFTATDAAVGLWLNNLGDMVLACRVKGPDGASAYGVFFVGRDGRWQPVFVGKQELPGGGKTRDEPFRGCAVNDAGLVTFLARREGEKHFSAFLWEQGKISTLLAPGADAPGGGKITSVSGAWLNNLNRDVILTAAVDNSSNHGIYRLSEGKLTAIVTPGQEMPGGGVFRQLRFSGDIFGQGAGLTNGLGPINMKGQAAFLATLQDGAVGVYRMEANGKLSLVMKRNQVVEQGTITHLGGHLQGAAPAPWMNSNGEIAVVLRLDNGPHALAILTPGSP